MNLQSGQKLKVSDLIGNTQILNIEVEFDAQFDVDISAFCLNTEGKLLADEYMVFFNNDKSPDQEVIRSSNVFNKVSFKIDLSKTNELCHKISLTSTADHPLKNINSGLVNINDEYGKKLASYLITPSQLNAEKAFMLVDIYKKDGIWRLGINGQGFNGGLDALVKFFGAEVKEESAPNNVISDPVSLKKKVVLDKVKASQPRLVDLTKKSLVSLEKKNLLDVNARVCLVLDRSGSMEGQYRRGDVQAIVERVIPLALNFDDDGALETWAFGQKPFRLDNATLNNIDGFVNNTKNGWKKWNIGSAVNDETKVIREVLEYYSKQPQEIPTYVIFISDGGVHDNTGITKAIIQAAHYPIFWQFVGIGGNKYGILEKLDNMTGRIIDNCSFFSLDHLNQIDEDQLYDLLLQEFPSWLKAAKQNNILR